MIEYEFKPLAQDCRWWHRLVHLHTNEERTDEAARKYVITPSEFIASQMKSSGKAGSKTARGCCTCKMSGSPKA